ncbi:hypothetical protein TSAR_003492, partial [Trichomalopsis sarcophagae]
MNGYLFNITLCHKLPMLVVREGDEFFSGGNKFYFFKTFSEKFNFTIRYIKIFDNGKLSIRSQDMMKSVQTSISEITTFPMMLGAILYKSKLIIGKAFMDDNLVMIAPILKNSFEVIRQEEVTFDVIKELDNPTFPVYMNTLFFTSNVHLKNDEMVNKLISKTTHVTESKVCTDYLIENRNCTCIVLASLANFVLGEYRNYDSTPIVRIVYPSVHTDLLAFGFKKGSPYVEKFDSVLQRIMESGIHHTWRYGGTYSHLKNPAEIIHT